MTMIKVFKTALIKLIPPRDLQGRHPQMFHSEIIKLKNRILKGISKKNQILVAIKRIL